MKYYNENGQAFDVNDSKEIARGGEGKIIEVSKTLAAKIYHPGRAPLNNTRFQELKVLSNSFIKPEFLLSETKGGAPAGFMMKLLPSDSFPVFAAFNSTYCSKNLLDDQWKVKIINKLIQGTDEAHKLNLILGDFNGFNILTYKNGDLFFIDVDSFGTPTYKHSGILFDEIRDHLYHGVVSNESDFFCLAALSFNILTYVHPFKGVHSKYKTLADRMIFKIPIFDNDKNLIVPKCYKPIGDSFLMDQYTKIFKKGERFPIQLTKMAILRKTFATHMATVETVDLIMKEVYSSDNIMYVKTSNTKCCIVEKSKITVLNVPVKSVYNVDFQIPNDPDIIEIFLSDQYVFALKKDSIGILDKSGTYTKCETFISDIVSYNHYDNILTIVFEDKIGKFHLNDVIISARSIKNTSDNVFGKQFTKYHGMVQMISGKSYIFYENKNTLNTVHFPLKLHDVIQSENFGIAEYFDNKTLRHSMFYVDGLSLRFDGTDIGMNKKFAYKKDQFVVMPENDILAFYRPSDFASIAKYECKIINDDSELFLTNAGIIARTDNKVFLVNKK